MRVARIYSEQAPTLRQAHAAGSTRCRRRARRGDAGSCAHIVGMMGHEPIVEALAAGADVVLAGRATDTAQRRRCAAAGMPGRPDLARRQDRRVRRPVHHQPALRRGPRDHRRHRVHHRAARRGRRRARRSRWPRTCCTRTATRSRCGSRPARWNVATPPTGRSTTGGSASRGRGSNPPSSTRSSSRGPDHRLRDHVVRRHPRPAHPRPGSTPGRPARWFVAQGVDAPRARPDEYDSTSAATATTPSWATSTRPPGRPARSGVMLLVDRRRPGHGHRGREDRQPADAAPAAPRTWTTCPASRSPLRRPRSSAGRRTSSSSTTSWTSTPRPSCSASTQPETVR